MGGSSSIEEEEEQSDGEASGFEKLDGLMAVGAV